MSLFNKPAPAPAPADATPDPTQARECYKCGGRRHLRVRVVFTIPRVMCDGCWRDHEAATPTRAS